MNFIAWERNGRNQECDIRKSLGELGQNDSRMDSPFITKGLNRPLPPKFYLPQLESYDDLKDPLDHIKLFKTMMHLQMTPNEVMCRAFPTKLKGSTRVWFSKIP